jgi:murein tripeptide amidase MpaA
MYMLKKCIFKIIPMINPDGVIYGNSRCDISGSDINRQWGDANKFLYPIINKTKNIFYQMVEEGY